MLFFVARSVDFASVQWFVLSIVLHFASVQWFVLSFALHFASVQWFALSIALHFASVQWFALSIALHFASAQWFVLSIALHFTSVQWFMLSIALHFSSVQWFALSIALHFASVQWFVLSFALHFASVQWFVLSIALHFASVQWFCDATYCMKKEVHAACTSFQFVNVCSSLCFALFTLAHAFEEQVEEPDDDKPDNDELDVFAIAFDFGLQLVLGHHRVQIPSQGSQDAVPCTGTEGGVEQELPIFHFRQASGDGNKVSDAWNEAPGDGGHHAVIVEILLAVFHLLLIEQTEFSPFAVGETIDERATQIVACKIVDGGTAVGSDGGK